MGMPADQIESMIRAALPDAQVTMTDLAGDNDHWPGSFFPAGGEVRIDISLLQRRDDHVPDEAINERNQMSRNFFNG